MTPAFLHRLSTAEGRRRAQRWLLVGCVAGFGLSGVVFGWDRWFFLLMLWTGVVYLPLRLAVEWLGGSGRKQRQRYRVALPDRITPANLPVAAQALLDREVLMPRIVTLPFVEKVHEAVVGLGRWILRKDPSGEGIRKVAVRLAAAADGWMAELGNAWQHEIEVQSIQARWRDIRLLAALLATTQVLAALYEEVAREPFHGPGVGAEALRTFVGRSLDFLDRAALEPDLPAWDGTLLGIWTPEANELRERWTAFCELPGPAPRRLEALLEVLEG